MGQLISTLTHRAAVLSYNACAGAANVLLGKPSARDITPGRQDETHSEGAILPVISCVLSPHKPT